MPSSNKSKIVSCQPTVLIILIKLQIVEYLSNYDSYSKFETKEKTKLIYADHRKFKKRFYFLVFVLDY